LPAAVTDAAAYQHVAKQPLTELQLLLQHSSREASTSTGDSFLVQEASQGSAASQPHLPQQQGQQRSARSRSDDAQLQSSEATAAVQGKQQGSFSALLQAQHAGTGSAAAEQQQAEVEASGGVPQQQQECRLSLGTLKALQDRNLDMCVCCAVFMQNITVCQ
jgi:hypothetical protein